MRRGVCHRVCVGLAAAAAAGLAGCSSSTPLAQVTTDPLAPSTSAPTTGSTAGTTTSASTATGVPTAVQLTVQAYPATITGEAKDAADAYIAYWRFVGTSGSDPQGVDVVAGVGKVATGTAANTVVSQVSSWKQRGVHLVGQVTISVRAASTSGASATVCGGLVDVTSTASADGSLTKALAPDNQNQKGTLQKDGPTWRVDIMTRVDTC